MWGDKVVLHFPPFPLIEIIDFSFALLDFIVIDLEGFKKTKASLPSLVIQWFMVSHSLHVFEKPVDFLFLHLLFDASTSIIVIFCEVSLHDPFDLPFDSEKKSLSSSTTKSFFSGGWRGKVSFTYEVVKTRYWSKVVDVGRILPLSKISSTNVSVPWAPKYAN